MTDAQIPKGAQTQSITTLPNVAWFEFILNEKLLHEHLNLENPDPSPCQLIVQFLQQAEIEMAAVIQAANEKKAQNNLGTLTIPLNKTDEAPEIIEPTKKVKALRLLALKVGCHLRWNLMAMEKGVPTPVLQALLILLLQVCVPNVIDNIHNPDLEVSTLTELGFFVVHLFHRWCIRSVVRDSFPSKPVRQGFTTLPGQVDPQVVMAQATDEIIRKFKEELPASINFLENCLHILEVEHHTAIMPTEECFSLPNEDTDSRLLWSNTIGVTAQEITCQICYDLGSLYFFKGDYRKSYEKFRICNQLNSQLKDPVYCVIDVERLRGYLTSCSSLLGVPVDINVPNLFERAEMTRRNGYQGLVEVFIEDNLKQELDMAYRNNLQEELLQKGLSDLYTNIYLCNVVRTVLEGKTLVLPILGVLKEADLNTSLVAVQILSAAMKGSSVLQRSNLKSFIWQLAQLLPPESSISQQLLASDLASYFNEVELAELSLEDPDLNSSLLLDAGMEDPMAMTSYPSTRESSYNMSDIEGQLLAVYDPKLIKDILVELYENRRLNALQIISLNDRWKVPKELKQLLDSNVEKLKEFDRIYLYVLIAKARHCMELKIFERARHILLVAEPLLINTSYVGAKHVKWQILLAELSQYTFDPDACKDLNLQDLITQCKHCLTIIRLGQDIIPSVEVVEHCCAFLCNIGEWQYLADLNNTADGFIELSHLLALFVYELQTKKNVRKQGRDLWDAVLAIFQPGNTKRPQSAHESAVRRDQQCGILPINLFVSFLQRIKEQTILSVMISLFAKLFSILKDDVTSEIATEYNALWPTALGASTAVSVPSVEETLKLVLAHSLQVDPMQPSWLRTQADIYFAQGQYATAIKYYLEAGVVATDFFTCPVPRSIYDDVIFRRMIKCCSYLQCHTQVAVLCQYLEEVDYNTAFKALQERNVYDAMDAYYCCIWDVSILEFLVHLHTKKGEMDKRQTALRALSQMDLNSNNPDPIQRRAVHIRKTKFLRALAKQYLG